MFFSIKIKWVKKIPNKINEHFCYVLSGKGLVNIWNSPSLSEYFVVFSPLAIPFLLEDSLPLEIIFLIVNILHIRVLIDGLLRGNLLVFGPDSNYFTDDSLRTVDISSLIDNSSEFIFLAFIHVHDYKLVGVDVIGAHNIDTLKDFLLDWKDTIWLLVVKVNKGRSDLV